MADYKDTLNLPDTPVPMRGSAERVLRDLWDTLGLPGADLATGVLAAVHAPGAVLVEPSREDVARFNRTVHEVRRWREEVEGDR